MVRRIVPHPRLFPRRGGANPGPYDGPQARRGPSCDPKLISVIAVQGGHGAVFHRLFDSRGAEHRVFTAAESIRDRAGEFTAIHGFTVDLTASLAVETSRAAAEAVRGAYATKAIIEQAKGLIMGFLAVDAESAFGVLCARSQNTNTKLATLASTLVEAEIHGLLPQTLQAWGIRAAPLNRATRATPPVLKSAPRAQG